MSIDDVLQRCRATVFISLVLVGCEAASPATAPPPPLSAATPSASSVQPLTEEDKIEQLLTSVAAIDGQFIRNGTPHTPAEAVAHLRLKLSNDPQSRESAQAFVTRLATRSSFSGEPYMIILTDGTEIPAGEFLQNRLQELESAGSSRKKLR